MKYRLVLAAVSSTVLFAAAACDDNNDPVLLPGPGMTITFGSSLTGANVRPTPVSTAGTGTAILEVNGSSAVFRLTANGLSSVATAASLHVGGTADVGPVIFPFTVNAVQSGTVASGIIDMRGMLTPGGITGDSLRVLLRTGNAYIDVSTVNFPAGEIRGQFVRQ